MHTPSLAPLGLALLLAGSAASAQTLQPVPAPLLDALDLADGGVQHLALPQHGAWQPFETRVVLDGTARTLRLEPHSLFAEGFRLVHLRADGSRLEESPVPTTYRGTVAGLPDAVAAVNLFQGQLVGLVLSGEDVWAIQPATEAFAWLPRTAHVVYRDDQVRPLPYTCGVDHAAEPVDPAAARALAPDVCEIAAELEPRFVSRFGGVAGALNEATAILNGMDAIYQRDVDIAFQITSLVTREAGYPTNSTAVLGQMRSIWNARALDIKRDVAHLFMGAPSSGVLGIAYLGTICGSSAYGVSWVTGSLVARVAVTAHEVGHGWSAGHCDGFNPCYLMCSGIGGCSGNITLFAPVSQNQIRNFANTRTCLNQ